MWKGQCGGAQGASVGGASGRDRKSISHLGYWLTFYLWMKPRSESHRLRLHRSHELHAAFLVTKNVQPRKQVLRLRERQLVVNSLQFSVESSWVRIAAYVVMPDHWHALVGLMGTLRLEDWMHHIMSFVASRTTQYIRRKGCVWQDGFHDVEVRSRKQFLYLLDYVHWNPVRANLVKCPDHWETSSCKRPTWIEDPWI